jgi:cob(I)alamin adenosyltransferase
MDTTTILTIVNIALPFFVMAFSFYFRTIVKDVKTSIQNDLINMEKQIAQDIKEAIKEFKTENIDKLRVDLDRAFESLRRHHDRILNLENEVKNLKEKLDG